MAQKECITFAMTHNLLEAVLLAYPLMTHEWTSV